MKDQKSWESLEICAPCPLPFCSAHSLVGRWTHSRLHNLLSEITDKILCASVVAATTRTYVEMLDILQLGTNFSWWSVGFKSIFPAIGSGRSIEQTFVGKEHVMGRKSIWVGGYLPHRVEILRDGVGEGQGVKIWSGESKKENRFLWRQIVGKNHSSSVVNSITNQFWKTQLWKHLPS